MEFIKQVNKLIKNKMYILSQSFNIFYKPNNSSNIKKIYFGNFHKQVLIEPKNIKGVFVIDLCYIFKQFNKELGIKNLNNRRNLLSRKLFFLVKNFEIKDKKKDIKSMSFELLTTGGINYRKSNISKTSFTSSNLVYKKKKN